MRSLAYVNVRSIPIRAKSAAFFKPITDSMKAADPFVHKLLLVAENIVNASRNG